jgi:hypothetical protein
VQVALVGPMQQQGPMVVILFLMLQVLVQLQDALLL